MGVLHRGDFHPYEIRRRLTRALIECFTDVDTGTLYYAVRKLAANGFFLAIAQERVPRGGVRTVYRITASGRQRFQELLHLQFAAAGELQDTLYGPMLFLHLANHGRVAEALRRRIEGLEKRIAELTQLNRQWAELLPTGSRYLMEHMAEQRRLDLRWIRAVLADVEGGRILDTPDPASLTGEK